MEDAFGIGCSQLDTDGTMEFLQRVVEPTDWLLVRVILSTRIPSFFSLHADSVCMMDHDPGSNLDSAVTDQAQLLTENAKLFLSFVDLSATCGLISRASEAFGMMTQAAYSSHKISAALQQRSVPSCLDVGGHT